MIKVKSTAATYATRTHSDVDAYELEDGRVVNFYNFNGEVYGEWWNDNDDSDCGSDARPVYRECGEDQFVLVGFEL